MLTFLSLGSGSCGNCYYIATENDAIIVDCGVGIRRFKRVMMEYGMKAGKVKAILITHDHADHIKAAGKISNELNVPVYATQLVHEGMDRNYQASVKVMANNKHTVTPDETFNVGPFQITAFGIPHDASENVGYMIATGDYRFCIMTDVGTVTDNVKEYIQAATHLVLEANYASEMLAQGRYPEILKQRITSGHGHLSNSDSALALATNMSESLKNVWLCHLSEENNHPELARKTFETTLRSFGIIAGTDFTLDVLRRRIPTGPFVI